MSNGQNQEVVTPQDTAVNEEIRDPKAVLEKNRELLGKNKELALKAKEASERLAKLEEEKMLSEGKKDELLESLKKKVSDLEASKNKLGWNVISSQIAIEAAKRGCVNSGTLMKVIDFEGASINSDDLTIAQEDIAAILDKATKEHDYLFKKATNPPKDGGLGNSTPPVDLKKSSMDDLKNMYRNLK